MNEPPNWLFVCRFLLVAILFFFPLLPHSLYFCSQSHISVLETLNDTAWGREYQNSGTRVIPEGVKGRRRRAMRESQESHQRGDAHQEKTDDLNTRECLMLVTDAFVGGKQLILRIARDPDGTLKLFQGSGCLPLVQEQVKDMKHAAKAMKKVQSQIGDELKSKQASPGENLPLPFEISINFNRRLFQKDSQEPEGVGDAQIECACSCGVSLDAVDLTILTRLPCGHDMHEDCSRIWFSKNRNCPAAGCDGNGTKWASQEKEDLELQIDTSFKGAISTVFKNASQLAIKPSDRVSREYPLQGTVTFTSMIGIGSFDAEFDGEQVHAVTIHQQEMTMIGMRAFSAVVRVFGQLPEKCPVLDQLPNNACLCESCSSFKMVGGIRKLDNLWITLSKKENIECQTMLHEEPLDPEFRTIYI